MEATQMKIGGSIASLRKARGLTQEQLAQQLGVSAPAVSKWETDSSYPDITLLCPLARAPARFCFMAKSNTPLSCSVASSSDKVG